MLQEYAYLHSLLGPLDAGFTKSYYKMLDIMYYYGNDATKELAVAMGKKEEGPSGTSTNSVTQRHSSSASSNGSIYSPTGECLHCFSQFSCDAKNSTLCLHKLNGSCCVMVRIYSQEGSAAKLAAYIDAYMAAYHN